MKDKATSYRRNEDKPLSKPAYNKMRNRSNLTLLIAVIVLLITIIFTVGPVSINVINNEKPQTFTNEWKCSADGSVFVDMQLPFNAKIPANSEIVLKNMLPTEMVKGATVMIRTTQQSVKVFVGDTEIYGSYDAKTGEQNVTSAYHFVRMPTEDNGEEITVILRSPYERTAGAINQIYIGSKASNIFFVIGENWLNFVIGMFVLALGVIIVSVFTFARKNHDKESIIYMGAFFAAAGLWVVMESKMAQFIIPHPVLLTSLSVFALTLMPVFIGLYYYTIHESLFKRFELAMIVMMCLACVGMVVICCINPMVPLHILPVYLSIMAVYSITIFVLIVLESVRDGSFFSLSICGILIFGVCGVLEGGFYLANPEDYSNSSVMLFGLMVLTILTVADMVKNYTRVYQEAIKVDTLTVLAYTDSLTQLKNRTAFLESMSKISEDSHSMVSMVMFDINNLKIVNDTMGHLVGDAMIRHSVKTMKESLRKEDELYRIGGDEFASILFHDKELDVEHIEARIVENVKKENEKALSYKLSFAYGFATFSENTDKTFFETLARADDNMYARKKAQKMSENSGLHA